MSSAPSASVDELLSAAGMLPVVRQGSYGGGGWGSVRVGDIAALPV